ncbi:unnamed protein product [Brassica rapa subsp. trilocularis]
MSWICRLVLIDPYYTCSPLIVRENLHSRPFFILSFLHPRR